jgi:hypothetical protein
VYCWDCVFDHFVSRFTASLWGLYWSFYGYVWPVEYDIVVGQAGPGQQRVEHNLTQVAGESMSAVYHACVNITMLNLIVSMMASTTDQILVSAVFVFFSDATT